MKFLEEYLTLVSPNSLISSSSHHTHDGCHSTTVNMWPMTFLLYDFVNLASFFGSFISSTVEFLFFLAFCPWVFWQVSSGIFVLTLKLFTQWCPRIQAWSSHYFSFHSFTDQDSPMFFFIPSDSYLLAIPTSLLWHKPYIEVPQVCFVECFSSHQTCYQMDSLHSCLHLDLLDTSP